MEILINKYDNILKTFFFLKICWTRPFLGATDTPVFGFWWRLFWVSMPESAALSTSGRYASYLNAYLFKSTSEKWHVIFEVHRLQRKHRMETDKPKHLNCCLIGLITFLPRPNEVCEGYVFTGFCLSTGGSRSLSGGRVSVWGGLCLRGSLSGGGLCPGEVSVRGDSIQGEGFCRGGLCPRWSLSTWGLCPGRSLSRGGLCQGDSPGQRPPRTVKSGR